MAPIKRKRNCTAPKPNKRTKHVPLSEQEYSASCILDERILQGVRKYRVQWTDIDPNTGNVYEPTWEPRDALNEALVASWEEDKAQKGIASVNEQSGLKKSKGRPKKNGKGQQRSRSTRVVDSSPKASIAQPSSLPSTPLTSARNSVAGGVQSSAVTTPIDPPASPSHQSPLVQVNIRGDSLERGEYDPHSQIPQSTLVSSQVHTQEIDLGSPPFLTSAFPHSPGVIPDSQSTAGDESFVPPIQHTEDTFPRSTSTDDSEVEEVTEDSGLLEIVQEAESHAISSAVSPARSIAETIAETVGNSQSQQQTVGAKGLRTNFNNFDPIESFPQVEEEQFHINREDEPHVAAGSVDEWQQCTTEPAPVNRSSGFEDPQPIRSTLAAATLAEPVLEHNTNAYPPPEAQHATYPDPTLQQSVSQVFQQGQFDSGAQATIGVDSSDNRADEIHTDKPHFSEAADSIVVPESSQSEPSQAKGKEVGVIPQLQEQDDDLLNQFLVPEYGRSPSPAVPRQSPIQEREGNAIAQSIEASESVVDVTRPSQDATGHLLVPGSTTQFSASREQNAQIIPVGTGLSTEENTSESIRPTIEREHSVRRGSSGSRHDSSQETPERLVKSTTHSSSPIPFPPSHSTGTFDSRAPPRPVTPAAVSSPSVMAGEDIGDEVARELKERLAKRAAENPFTPTRRILKSSLSPFTSASAPVPAQDTLAPPMSSTRRLFQANISPAEGLEGTRSPSMVPDRSPVSHIPTSLRIVAVAPANNISASLAHDVDSSTRADADPEAAEMDGMVAAEDMGLHHADSDANDPDDLELSDADNDDDSDESLLNDDLNLDREEYIVPLSIEGRQRDMYAGYITQNKDVLEQFLKDGQGHSSVSEVDAVLSHLRAIETHIDLVFAEAETASRSEMNSETQIEFAAQFGMENSAKFRFLHWLVDPLQKYNKHLIILTETGEDPLYNILETFFQAKSVDYRMPTKNRRADPEQVQGELVVDIFPGNESPAVQPPDMIICLDGVQDANSIRQNDWARGTGGDIIPLLHLVIPRTVGHIERYISPTLYAREHVHTTLASLAQMRSELGWPLDDDTPGARESAELVFGWLMAGNDDEGLSWPLPSIGSVKDVIEFQTQLSQASKATPPPERTKRPLDDEILDSAKRRRYTPQPEAMPSSTLANNEAEVTRISDSIPGSMANPSTLQKQLSEMEEAYQKEHALRQAEEQRFHEHEEMWDKQQTAHETLIREHRLLLSAQKASDEKLETMTKNIETLRERLATRTAENRQLTTQLDEQRATHLLSDDDKIATITQLRKDLDTAQQDMQRATKNAQTAESTLEYTKEQYRLAQEAATFARSSIDQLTAENAKLSHAASGELAKLKAMHLDRQYENKNKQIRSLTAELANVKRALGLKEEELTRWKNNIGRVGVGTRGQSLTPQPKVRSRAASPLGGRLSNLRNG